MADGKIKKNVLANTLLLIFFLSEKYVSLCKPNNYKIPCRTDIQFLLYSVVNTRLEIHSYK